MKIYIIRHGQTEWNKSGRLQGQTDIALNENGRELAIKVSQALKDIPFDRAVSSPLSRSIETAELVLRENVGRAGEALRCGAVWKRKESLLEQKQDEEGSSGEDVTQATEQNALNAAGVGSALSTVHETNILSTDEHIKEISFGEYEGFSIPSTSMFTGDPKFAITDPEFHNFFDAPEKYQPPKGGESISHLIERAGEFLKELAEEARAAEQQEELILVSTHGAASRALLANIKHTELKDFWYPGVPKNCSVSIAELRDGVWEMVEQDVIYY